MLADKTGSNMFEGDETRENLQGTLQLESLHSKTIEDLFGDNIEIHILRFLILTLSLSQQAVVNVF